MSKHVDQRFIKAVGSVAFQPLLAIRDRPPTIVQITEEYIVQVEECFGLLTHRRTAQVKDTSKPTLRRPLLGE
jgi:hypothetical protein